MSTFFSELVSVLYSFLTQDYNFYIIAGLLFFYVLLLVLYLIRFRVFTTRREALYLQKINQASLVSEATADLSAAPKRIARARSICIEAITGHGVGAPRHSAYGLGAVCCCGLITVILLFPSPASLIFSAALWLLLFFVLFTGRKAYTALEEQCQVYNRLSGSSLTLVLARIEKLLSGLPDMSKAVYTTKELAAAIAHAQATADAAALETLVDRYCVTMNSSLNGQLARMGEVMQSTIDAQNEMRKALRLLLNDMSAATAELKNR